MSGAASALVERVLGDQRLELGDDAAAVAERELGLGAVGQRGQAQVVEPGGGGGERLARRVGQRRAAPERERLAQRRGGALGSPLRSAPAPSAASRSKRCASTPSAVSR